MHETIYTNFQLIGVQMFNRQMKKVVIWNETVKIN